MWYRLRLRRGLRLLRGDDLEAALRYYSDLTRRFPRSPEAWYEAGKLLYKKGDRAGARAAFLRAVDGSPGPETIRGILEVTNWRLISPSDVWNSDPAFSPDGRELLFVSARKDTNGDGKIDAQEPCGIYRADLDTGRVQEVVPPDGQNTAPVWAPDGRAFLFRRAARTAEGPAKEAELVLKTFDGGAERRIAPPEWAPRYPAFLPDGRRLVLCTVDHMGGPSGLSLIDLGTGERRALTSHAWEHTFPQVSPDGHTIVFVSWRSHAGRSTGVIAENPGLYSLDLYEGKQRQLVGDEGSNAFPRYAPDGRHIVYLSRRRDTNGDGRIDALDHFGIYRLSLDRRQERRLVSDDHFNKFPAWSPDGKWILFLARWPDRHKTAARFEPDYFEYKGLYRVSSDGGSPHTIVSDKFFGSRFCEVAPRGTRVAYVSWRPRTNRGLYVADYMTLPSPDILRAYIAANLADV